MSLHTGCLLYIRNISVAESSKFNKIKSMAAGSIVKNIIEILYHRGNIYFVLYKNIIEILYQKGNIYFVLYKISLKYCIR